MSSIAQTAADQRGETSMRLQHVRALRLWLAIVAALIVAMVLVGGATRLTNSGLSITEWQPIMGVIPPLNEADWQKAFAAYQKIPQYSELNQGMSREDFKTIFWWEWAHRFLGRFIGVAFLGPFIIFWVIGYIPRALLPRFIGLFVLGGLQGALGWYMVKSGLIDRTDVSQYRLAAHFGVALSILGYTLWLLFGLGHEGTVERRAESSRAQRIVAGGILALVFLQLLAGALVAGLDAGRGYNTWPLINGAFIPNGLFEVAPWYLNVFENPLTVQFDHRMIGYTVVVVSLAQLGWLAWRAASSPLIGSAMMLALLALLQATLGVWTLLLAVPIELGLAHQAGAVAVFAAAVYNFWMAIHAPHTSVTPQARASA
jgi:heme a synthase